MASPYASIPKTPYKYWPLYYEQAPHSSTITIFKVSYQLFHSLYLKFSNSMASKTSTMKFFSLLISSFAIIQMARAGDPDILSDFIVPPNVTTVDASFFTFTGMRFLVPTTTFKVSKISLAEFPALNGQVFLMLYFNSQLAPPTQPTFIPALLSSFS